MVNASEPCFFAFFSPSSTSERLKIPEKFIKHISDGTTGSIVLMGPNGSSWHVDLIQQDDGLFLRQGWPEFARDNFLECGDLLVFRYDGELHFTVEVFDQSACKKEYVFNSECSQKPCEFDKNDRQKREREADGVSSTGIFEGVPKRSRGCSAVSYPTCRVMDANAHLSDKEGCRNEEVITTETLREENYSRETNQYGSLAKIYSTPWLSKDCSGKPEADVKKGTGREENLDMHGCYLSILPENEEKRVAQSFTSSFPFFVRVMKRFNISGSYTLNIPYKFSMAHLPTCKTEIVLRNLKGACWTVNSVPTKRVHTSHTLCGGWMSFVRDNDIKMEDICVFELVYKSEFCVHILRVGKEKSNMLSEKQALHGVNVGCAATWYKTPDGLLNKVRKTSSKFHAKYLKKVGSCDKSGSNKGQESSSPNRTKKHGSAIKKSAAEGAIGRGNSMETELGSRAGGGSRIVMARDEEKAAKTFASGFPHFVRIMRKFNVSGSYTLKIPHKFSAAYLPNCKSEIVIRNSKGENWTVNSVPDSKGRMVNTFCGGWMAFVRGNDLKEGDVCIFELVNTCEMRVHISGVEKILLDLQCGNT